MSSDGIRADKRFGQHFLVNEGVIERIANMIDTLAREGGGTPRTVIEIGPGPGALTGALLARGLKLVALELDERMVAIQREKFATQIAAGLFDLVHGDALHYPLEELEKKCQGGKAVLCGNLPYNVGSQVVFRYLEEFPPADRFCYMLQKEVVLKFISSDRASSERRDYGPPGIKLSWCTRPRGHFWVSPGSFSPPPKVDSGVFSFERLGAAEFLADPLAKDGSYERAGKVLEKAFQQRRKMLRAIFPDLATTPWATKRAEELSPVDLFRLTELIKAS